MPAARKAKAARTAKAPRKPAATGYAVLREMEVWREDPTTGERDIREVAWVHIGTVPDAASKQAAIDSAGGEGRFKAVPAASWLDTIVMEPETRMRARTERDDAI